METLDANAPPELLSNLEVQLLLTNKYTCNPAFNPSSKSSSKSQSRGGEIDANGSYLGVSHFDSQLLSFLRRTSPLSASVLKLQDKGGSRACEENEASVLRFSGLVSLLVQSRDAGGFALEECEAVQVLNLLPSEVSVLHLIVADCEARFNEDEQAEIMKLIAKYKRGAVGGEAQGEAMMDVKL